MSSRGERDAENGRPAQQGAIAGRELVDARRDERLDGLGKLLGLVGLSHRRSPARCRKSGLPAPRSMSAASSSSVRRRSPAAATASVLASSAGSGSSRSVKAGSGGVPSAAANPPSDRPSRRTREPRLRRKLRAEVAEQLGRRVVHPVDVVEDEQRRRVEQLTQERAHDAVEPCAPEGRVEVAHLGRCLDLDVERGREEGRPGNELLVDLVEALGEHGAVVLRRPRSARRRGASGERGETA